MDTRVAAIIPSRGNERKVFTEWQKQRAYDMGYDRVYLINYPPESDKMDLYDRINVGVQLAIGNDCEWCSVIEDDDFYCLDYLDVVKTKLDSNINMLGINHTMYYHLFTCHYKMMIHPGRSSMFCTTFRTEFFKDLPKQEHTGFLDLSWWQASKNFPVRLIDNDIATGIKHGIFGKLGGNGHYMKFIHYDRNMGILQRKMDKEAFEFYKSVKETYQLQFEKSIR